MSFGPHITAGEIRQNRTQWKPISREAALAGMRYRLVVVIHAQNGFEAASRFDESSPFYFASGPYDYAALRYFGFQGTLAFGGASGGRAQLKAKPALNEELELFDFPSEEIEVAEEEITQSALTTKPGKPVISTGPVLPGKPPLPGIPGKPALSDIPEVPEQVEAALAEGALKEEKSFYSLRVVDEAGAPVDGVALTLKAGGKNHAIEVKGGKSRVEGVDAGSGLLSAADVKAARRVVAAANTGAASQGLVAAARATPDGTGGKSLILRADADPVSVDTGKEVEVVLVVPAREVTVLEILDGMFRLDSAVVLPEAEVPSADGHESLATVSVFATTLAFAEANPSRKLLVAGHTDTSGTEKHNQELSEERAGCALACLEGGDANRTAFGDLCDARKKISDYKQVLSWAAKQFGFPCDPGKIDDVEFTGIEPIRAFQKAYNAARADLGVPGADELKLDGSMGPKTWRAVFDCYEAVLSGEVSDAAAIGERLSALADLRKKLKFVDASKKTLGFGESHPIAKLGQDNVRSQENRRVELLFFHEGEEPDLSLPPEDSEIYAGGIFNRVLLNEASPGSIQLFVTEIGKRTPVAGARIAAVGPATRVTLTGPDGMGSLADVPPGRYTVSTSKDGHWLDRIEVRVAAGSPGLFLARLDGEPVP